MSHLGHRISEHSSTAVNLSSRTTTERLSRAYWYPLYAYREYLKAEIAKPVPSFLVELMFIEERRR